MKKNIDLNLTATEKKVYERLIRIAAFTYEEYRGDVKLANENDDEQMRECAQMDYDMYTGQVRMIARLFGFGIDETMQVYHDVESLWREVPFIDYADDVLHGMLTLA